MTPATAHSAARGSIMAYILIAIFLTGLLVTTMMSGAQKSAVSRQADELVLRLQADVKTVQGAVTECVTTHSTPVDIDGDNDTDATDNPNPPFPLYCADSTCARSGMTSAGTGTDIANVGCPGAPDGQRPLFKTGALAVMANDGMNVRFFNDGTEGVYFRVASSMDDPIWMEGIARVEEQYSKCAAAVVTANPDPLGYDCSNGCLYYWVLRRATSDGAFEATCP